MEASFASSGNVHVRRATDIAEYRKRAEPYLVTDEARHNLLLGILSVIALDPAAYSAVPPYLATIERNDAVEGVALMTPPHNLVISQLERADAISALTDALMRDRIEIPGVVAPVPIAERFVGEWTGRGGPEMKCLTRQGIYRINHVREVSDVEGAARPADPSDRDLLVEWTVAFGHEAGQAADPEIVWHAVDRKLRDPDSGYYLWEMAGSPVSVTGYGGPTPNGIRIGPVYTPPEHRRRGYGAAVTAHTSRRLLAAGRRFCFLYTDLANPTSNSIYRKIGYEWVCESEEWRATFP